MKKIITPILMLLFAVVGNNTAFAYSGGNGTEQTPYLISSRADMEQLASAVNGGQSYAGTYFLLTHDLTATEDTVNTVIGNSNNRAFSGIFNGGGHEIAVRIDISSADAVYAGIFGYSRGATIKNLGVRGSVSASATTTFATASAYSGGICGYMDRGTISNCYNAAIIATSSLAFYSRSGGICGYVSNGTINNCYNEGEISSSSPYISWSGGISGGIGGIIGSEINSCYNVGNISSIAPTASYSGGICGDSSDSRSTIRRCFAANEQIESNAGDIYAGRICGRGEVFSLCYSSSTMLVNGNIISSTSSDNKEGMDTPVSSFKSQSWLKSNLGFGSAWRIKNGIFPTLGMRYSGGNGSQENPYLISSKADMEQLANAVNEGLSYVGTHFLLTRDLTNPADVVTTVVGRSYLLAFKGMFNGGGHEIVVNINGTINPNRLDYAGVFGYISGAVIENLGVSGSVSAQHCAGGICGYGLSATINNCYNKGEISSGTSSSVSSSISSAGGICGSGSSIIINNCYNKGIITSRGAGSLYSGSICGRTNSTVTIANCFAANEQVTNSESTRTRIGRIGGEEGTYQNCYALNIMLVNGGVISSLSSSSKDGQDTSLSSFQSQSWLKSLGWDFDNVWKIKDGLGFPTLRKEDEFIQFELPEVVYGDQILLQATSRNTTTPLVYKSSDNTVAEIAGDLLIAKKAGAATIIVSQEAGAGFPAVEISIDLIVKKRPLIVNASNISIIYGDVIPALTYTYDGFANGDNASNITVQPTATTATGMSANVGEYNITCSGGSAANYNFIYESGILTIQKRNLTITPLGKSRAYGDINPSFDFIYEGFVNGDNASNIIVQPTATTVAGMSANIGEYDITCSGGIATNYNFIYGIGKLTIFRAPLAVTVDNVSRVYGTDNPNFSIRYSGFKNGDTGSVILSAPQVTCDATSTSNVGQYPISVSGGSAQNYLLSHSNGLLTITAASQTINWNQTLAAICGDSPITLTATTNSGLPVSYTSSNPNVATISGNTLTIVGAGSATITAMQAGNGNYDAAADASNLLVVSKKDQSITWIQTLAATYGDSPITLTATTNSGLPISYTSSNSSEATVSGNTLTIVGAGSATITARQAGNGNYNAADVSNLLVVSKKTQTISWIQTLAATYGDSPITLTATTNSGLPISYTSSNSSVATISGNTLTIVGAGSATITAMQAGNGNYSAATDVSNPLVVNKKDQSITWDQSLGGIVGDKITLTATANSGLPVSYTSDNETVAIVVNNELQLLAEGTANITARQAGTQNYLPAWDEILPVTVDFSNSIDKVKVPQISIYPNPTKGIVNIKTNDGEVPKVYVYSMQGQLLLTETDNQVDISAFNDGMYVFLVGKTRTLVVKQK